MSATKHVPRVHLLGLGSIGNFAACALAEVPERPAITLLLHRPSLMTGYIKNGRKIWLETPDGKQETYGNYDFEVLHEDQKWYNVDPKTSTSACDPSHCLASPATEPIDNLILSVKVTQTVTALRPVASRLTRSSTIMFLQNGAGMIEDVNTHLFPNPETRPNYITGVISHGVTLRAPFDIIHTGPSATSLGPVPRESFSTDQNIKNLSSATSSYLLEALPQVPRLNATSYDFISILQLQLEKLAVNAFCNPLCALADSPNRYLLTIPETRRALMSEISRVVLALPELSSVPGVTERFSPESLDATVMSVVYRTLNTTCSMAWDLRAGRGTEIRYINGYWARRGREVGVATPVNDDLIAKIEARTNGRG